MTAADTETAGTIGRALGRATESLAQAGVPGPRMEARLLAASALGLDAATVFGHPEWPLEPEGNRCLDRLIRRRADGEPMAYITGEREFWSLPFRVTPDVLIPRPESETLIESVLARFGRRDERLKILDLGTGSGCLLLALLHELPGAFGVGVDISDKAIRVAHGNARALGLVDRVRFACADWGKGVAGRFDIVVASPPYISESDLVGEALAVARFEPRLALAGGVDGLDCIRALIPGLARMMGKEGIFFQEIGMGQVSAVSSIFHQNGLKVIDIKEDLTGIPRCISAAPG